MAISTVSINSVNQAQVSGYSVTTFWQGGAIDLANGEIRRDLVDANAKRKFSLTWVDVSGTELAALLTAHAATVNGDVTFVPPEGGSYTVNAGKTPSITYEAYRPSGADPRFRCSMELWEV